MRRSTPSSSSSWQSVDEATLDTAWQGIGARRVRARRVRRAWLATPILVALAAVLLFVVRRGPDTRQAEEQQAQHGRAQPIALLHDARGGPVASRWDAAAASDPDTRVVAFDDGSHLELDRNARVRADVHESSRVDVALEAGAVTFDIKPGGPRAWAIDAGTVLVRVLGTRFTVTRNDGHVRVAVARGKVRVESGRIDGGSRDLGAGQDIDIADVDTPARTVESLADAPAPAAPRSPPRAAPAIPVQPARIAPVDRMTQADVERRAGRPREAIAILEAAVDAHDPRASLAAFTLGKIHAEELAEPLVAASWFERAIRLGLPAGLDEDAHARVAETYGQAGRADDAARAAERYESKFRDGRHLARVRRWKRE